MTELATYEDQLPDLARLDWDGLVDLGRKIAYAGQWVLGDLACQVEISYGGSNLQRYAGDIGIDYDTLRRYRHVSAAFPAGIVPRGTHPWSVYRELAAEDDRLELISGDTMTVRRAQEIVWDRRRRQQQRERRRELKEQKAKAAEKAARKRKREPAAEPVSVEPAAVEVVEVMTPHCPTCSCYEVPA